MGSKCDNCLCNLKYCEAECCKEFRLNIGAQRVYPGKVIQFVEENEDMRYYFKTRGIPVSGDVVRVQCKNYTRVGKFLVIQHRCEKLSDENTCTLHNTPEQPRICQWPNKDSHGEGIVYLTKRCVFAKRSEENGKNI
jgi:hypothetical protein